MNYCYKIVPNDSYIIWRKCAGCGVKSAFKNTKNFRVNANGNRIDIWLIYQCEKCKHTYNLPIYERINPSQIDPKEYERFLQNDEELAILYGHKKEIFTKNHAEISLENMDYKIIECEHAAENTENIVQLQNPYHLKIRNDKVLSEIFKISRSKIKEMLANGAIAVTKEYGKILYDGTIRKTIQ